MSGESAVGSFATQPVVVDYLLQNHSDLWKGEVVAPRNAPPNKDLVAGLKVGKVLSSGSLVVVWKDHTLKLLLCDHLLLRQLACRTLCRLASKFVAPVSVFDQSCTVLLYVKGQTGLLYIGTWSRSAD